MEGEASWGPKKKADDEEVYTIEEPSFIPCINEITNYGSLISNDVHDVQDLWEVFQNFKKKKKQLLGKEHATRKVVEQWWRQIHNLHLAIMKYIKLTIIKETLLVIKGSSMVSITNNVQPR